MNNVTNVILCKFLMRNTRKQKDQFIAFMQGQIPNIKVETCGLFKNRNLILGDVSNAKVILTAHYDTCTKLPFPNFIAPKNFVASLLYGLMICLPLFIALFLVDIVLAVFIQNYDLFALASSLASIILFYFVFLAGGPNPNNVNDNTSGVSVLCELLSTLSADELNKVAFVFFDNEETGLLGSFAFYRKYRKEIKDKLVINLDCVSDGDNIMLVQSRRARKNFGALLKGVFLNTEKKTVFHEKSELVFYPSDQMWFPCHVAITALKRNKFIGLYLDRIHTKKDTIFDKTNIDFICRGIKKFLTFV